jgi:hypothetical protein
MGTLHNECDALVGKRWRWLHAVHNAPTNMTMTSGAASTKMKCLKQQLKLAWFQRHILGRFFD